MSLARAADFWAQIRQVAREEAHRARDGGSIYAEDGVIVSGSWNPSDGTVSVWLNETASLLPSSTEQPTPLQGVQLLAPVHLQQAGPVGGERVILMRRHSGWLALLEHGSDDSPGAPAGEHWYVHPTGSYTKHTNAGNVEIKANAEQKIDASTLAHTASGSYTAHGSSIQITGDTSATINAPVVHIGPSGGPYLTLGSGGGTYALVRVFELNALITAFNAHTHSGVQGGSGNSGAPNATVSPATGSTDATAG